MRSEDLLVLAACIKRVERMTDLDSLNQESWKGSRLTADSGSMQDDERLLTASGDCSVRVFDSETGVIVANLSGHTGSVKSAKHFGGSNLVVSGSRDGCVRVRLHVKWTESSEQQTVNFWGNQQIGRSLYF